MPVTYYHTLNYICVHMDMASVLQELVNQLHQTPLIEWTAVICGVASVLLAWRNHVALYPTGIISTGIYIYMLAQPQPGLYAEALLNMYYLVMSIYGWMRWQQRHEHENAAAITTSTKKDWQITLAIVVIGWGLLYLVLTTFTTSNVPVWDAFVSATAWAGMWLLAKHKLENWILLNISNLVAIPLWFYKHMPLTGFLTIFLFIVAIYGYLHWRQLYKAQHATL